MKLRHLHIVFLFLAQSVLQLAALDTSAGNSSSGDLAASKNGDSKGLCPSGWEVSPKTDKCFRYENSSLSWDESETTCKSYGGHLATLTSPQELSFARRLCGQGVNGCWIGGRGVNYTVDLKWRWSDNISYWNESIVYGVISPSNCSSSPCDTNIAVDSCTMLTKLPISVVAKECNTSHTYICMLSISMSSPVLWHMSCISNSRILTMLLYHGLDGSKCYHMHCHREYLIILAVVSGLILCTISAVVIWLLVHRRSKRHRKSHKLSNPAASELVHLFWRVFTNEELRSITKNFSEGNRLLGDAKTGGTYSGLLPDGSRVAVKRLKRSSFQRKKEFYSEIRRVARLHHPNLVAIKGCCYDHGDRYIVYEFVANGPLDRWLHHVPRGARSLDWEMRMKIATTLAQGIAFLHDKVKPQVVHRDIRASNVLVDEEFGAHIMGIGLSKFVPWEVMHERTVMAGGTYGYLAPEFVYRNELTTKSDVYSFGVLLLEIVSGRRPAQAVDSVGWQSIFEWATPLVQAHRYPELLDPLVSSSDAPEASVIQKVVDLVYACTQHVPSMRPRMSHVVHQLQQLTQTPVVK